jgi:mycofactocin precursor
MEESTVAVAEPAEPSGAVAPDETSEALADEPVADEPVAEELLVEEVSIDGMCGVY